MRKHDVGVYVQLCDLGLTHDRAVVTVMHKRLDGICAIDRMDVWQGEPGRPVEIEMVERQMEENHRNYPLKGWYCDPYQLAATIQKYQRLGRPIKEFTFGAASIMRLSEALYGAIINCRLAVPPGVGAFVDRQGKRSTFKSEVTNLVVKETNYGWRIDHKAKGFSDRSITAGMGIVVLSDLPILQPKVRSIQIDSSLVGRAKAKKRRAKRLAARAKREKEEE